MFIGTLAAFLFAFIRTIMVAHVLFFGWQVSQGYKRLPFQARLNDCTTEA
jgi:hypothetical protein